MGQLKEQYKAFFFFSKNYIRVEFEDILARKRNASASPH